MSVRRAASRLLVAAAVCLSGLAVPSSAFAERTIALSSGTFSPSLAPGQSAADRVMVANNGDEPLLALVYTADVFADEQGQQSYERPSADPANFLSSSASWVRVKVPDSTKIVANTPYLELDPGDELPVDFEVVVPPGAGPGDYNAVIFFEMFDFAAGSTGAVSKIQGRIGAKIDLRVVGDIVDRLEVGPFIASRFALANKTTFSTMVRNQGNIDKRFSARLELVGEGNEIVWSRELDSDVNLYAANDRAYNGVVEFDGVGFGSYTFRTVVDYQKEIGGETGALEQAQEIVDRSIWVVPLWVAILLVIVVALPILYAVYRFSTRGPRAPRSPAPSGRTPDPGPGEPGERVTRAGR
ncbi:MAG: hypothetical protein U1E29_12355, partial [Coriobacteriia bacterium]|nr:hypothetical protein [Coriobacteriia bacterium]